MARPPGRAARDRRPAARGAAWGGGRASRRPATRWGTDDDPFPGATVLEDLDAVDGEVEAAYVLARYLVLRLALRAATGETDDLTLPLERAAAAAYLTVGAAPDDPERRALEAVIRLTGPRPDSALVAALVEAGGAAAERGHAAGARALLVGAHAIGVAAGYPASAAAAAKALAQLAAATGYTRAARLWRRRARVLAGRADQAGGAGEPRAGEL